MINFTTVTVSKVGSKNSNSYRFDNANWPVFVQGGPVPGVLQCPRFHGLKPMGLPCIVIRAIDVSVNRLALR